MTPRQVYENVTLAQISSSVASVRDVPTLRTQLQSRNLKVIMYFDTYLLKKSVMSFKFHN